MIKLGYIILLFIKWQIYKEIRTLSFSIQTTVVLVRNVPILILSLILILTFLFLSIDTLAVDPYKNVSQSHNLLGKASKIEFELVFVIPNLISLFYRMLIGWQIPVFQRDRTCLQPLNQLLEKTMRTSPCATFLLTQNGKKTLMKCSRTTRCKPPSTRS